MKLKPIESNDLLQLKKWRNQSDLMSRARGWKKLSSVDQEKWFNSLYGDKHPENIMFGIFLEVSSKDLFFGNKVEHPHDDGEKIDRLVGVCGLCHIDYINRSAEISIYIGDKEYQRKGHALSSLQELKRIAFEEMNLRRLWVEAYTGGPAMHNLFKKAGYEKEAVLKKTTFKFNDWQDSVFYTLFKEGE